MPYADKEKDKQYHRNYSKRWAAQNPEKMRQYQKDYYVRNRDAVRERKNKQKAQPQSREVRERRYHRSKVMVLRKYGGDNPRCVCCGEDKYEFLTIDHIVPGNGYYRTKATGENLYYILMRETTDRNTYQILCYNCNMGKRTRPDCPHHNQRFCTIAEWWEWAKPRKAI